MFLRRAVQNVRQRNLASLTTINSAIVPQVSSLQNFTKIDLEANKHTLHNKIMTDKGLKKYMKDIYFKSGVGFATSLGISASVPIVLSTLPLSPGLLISGYVANVGLSFYSIYKMSKYNSKTIEKDDGLYELTDDNKEFWYKTFCISNGITIAPLVGLTLMTNPVAIPLATVATLSTFGGATYAALKQTDTNLVQYQGPLIGCLWGLIGTGIAEMIAISMGYSSLANSMDIFASVASVGVFTALVAVDTQKAIDDYNQKVLDSTNVCVELLLDATNLFIDFIKLLNRLTGKDDD